MPNEKSVTTINIPLDKYIKEVIKEYGESKYRSKTAQARKILEDWVKHKGLL